MKHRGTLVGTLLVAAAAGAQAPVEVKAMPDGGVVLEVVDDGRLTLGELIVRARRPQRVESLEVRDLRERSAVDLGEALAKQGLASRVRRGAIASDLVIRGYQRDALSVTIDGAQVHGACPNRMDPPAFHVDAAEVGRVEVRKGPFDVTLPGVLGGSVNAAPRQPKPGLTAEVNLMNAFNANGEGSAVLGWCGERFDVLGLYALKVARPYVSGAGTPMTAVYGPTVANRYQRTTLDSAYQMHTASLQAGGSLLGAGKDRLQLGYTFQKADGVLYPFLLMDAVFDDTHRLNATWKVGELGPLRDLTVQGYFNRVDHLMNDAQRCSSTAMPATCTGALPNRWSMETRARSQLAGGRLNARLGAFGVGLDGYHRTWDTQTTRFNRVRKEYLTEASLPATQLVDVGAWGTWEARLGDAVRVRAGVRLDVAASDVQRARLPAEQVVVMEGLFTNYGANPAQLAKLDVLPGANVQLDWRPSPGLTVSAGLGHAARPPDPQERYFALSGSPAMGATPARPGRIGQPGLRPMHNTELDLGVSHVGQQLTLRVQAFASQATDAILLTSTTGENGVPALTWANGTARLVGGELMMRAALTEQLFLLGGLNYTHGWNARGAPLQEVPPFNGRVAFRWDDGKVFAEAEELFAVEQPRVDASVGEQVTPGWYVTNLRVGVTNLFDLAYVEHLNFLRDPFASGARVPEPGRSLFVALQAAL